MKYLKPAERQVIARLIGGQDPQRAFGYPPTSQRDEDALRLVRAKIDVALVAQGFIQPDGTVSREEAITHDVLRRYREQARQLQATVTQPVPIVGRVQHFLDEHLRDVSPSGVVPQLPRHVLVLAEHGLARELSFPPGAKSFVSETLSSYRVLQGVVCLLSLFGGGGEGPFVSQLFHITQMHSFNFAHSCTTLEAIKGQQLIASTLLKVACPSVPINCVFPRACLRQCCARHWHLLRQHLCCHTQQTRQQPRCTAWSS